MPRPLIVIAGPTGAGKSDVALALAELAGAEVISADSQQVYRGMDIGTGKVSRQVRERIPHHGIDIAEPDQEMTVATFLAVAEHALQDARRRGVPVVVVGGTMLYVRALLLGLFEGPPADAAVRARWLALADTEGDSALFERLRAVDPELAERIGPGDRRRMVRALEVHELTGVPMSEHQRQHDFRTLAPRYPHRLICLAPEAPALNARIDARVDAMLDAGWLGEVETLRARGYDRRLRSQQAIGYGELHQVLDGTLEIAEAIERIKRNSRRYARRQRSWYRNDPTGIQTEWAAGLSDIDLDGLRRYLGGP